MGSKKNREVHETSLGRRENRFWEEQSLSYSSQPQAFVSISLDYTLRLLKIHVHTLVYTASVFACHGGLLFRVFREHFQRANTLTGDYASKEISSFIGVVFSETERYPGV